MPTFSIIIPHYNSWNQLEDLLKTIPINKDIEIIVIDDHTKDANERIKNFKFKYPTITFKSNYNGKKNAGSARNKGIELAKGKWLLFADADDLFEKDFYNIIRKHSNSDSQIVYFSPSSFNENNNTPTRHINFSNYIQSFINNQSVANEIKLRSFFVVPWSKMIRRSFILEADIKFEEIIVSNDIMFSVQTGLLASKISASSEIIYSVRQASGSLTTTINRETFLIRLNAWVRYISFIRKNIPIDYFKQLNISGTPKIIDVIRYKLGLKTLLITVRKLKYNNISLLDKRLFSPYFLAGVIKKYKNIWSVESKFINPK